MIAPESCKFDQILLVIKIVEYPIPKLITFGLVTFSIQVQQ